MCGGDLVKWTEVLESIDYDLRPGRSVLKDESDKRASMYSFLKLYSIRDRSGPVTLEDLIFVSQHREATDPRDPYLRIAWIGTTACV